MLVGIEGASDGSLMRAMAMAMAVTVQAHRRGQWRTATKSQGRKTAGPSVGNPSQSLSFSNVSLLLQVTQKFISGPRVVDLHDKT